MALSHDLVAAVPAHEHLPRMRAVTMRRLTGVRADDVASHANCNVRPDLALTVVEGRIELGGQRWPTRNNLLGPSMGKLVLSPELRNLDGHERLVAFFRRHPVGAGAVVVRPALLAVAVQVCVLEKLLCFV